jgi:hypothetical protein
MQPQKYVAMSRKDRPEHLRLGWWQWIVNAVTTVIEQHGWKRSAARGTPQLCAQRQRSGSHFDYFRRGCGLVCCIHQQRESGGGETGHADD